MDFETFLAKVLDRLPVLALPENQPSREGLRTLFQEGFTVDEAVAFEMCSEEINPQLDENIALRRMAAIRLAVKNRSSLCTKR